MKYVLDRSDVIPGSSNMDYTGKMLVVALDSFKPEYQEAKSQLFKATGGFGCKPENLGTKIFGSFTDEDGAMVRRGNVLGIATDECVRKWTEVYGEFGGK